MTKYIDALRYTLNNENVSKVTLSNKFGKEGMLAYEKMKSKGVIYIVSGDIIWNKDLSGIEAMIAEAELREKINLREERNSYANQEAAYQSKRQTDTQVIYNKLTKVMVVISIFTLLLSIIVYFTK